MVVQVNLSAPIARSSRTVVEESGSHQAPRGGRLRPIFRGVWRFMVNALSGPGLDDSKLPSSFEAPYGRGSRQVRSLWHMPF